MIDSLLIDFSGVNWGNDHIPFDSIQSSVIRNDISFVSLIVLDPKKNAYDGNCFLFISFGP